MTVEEAKKAREHVYLSSLSNTVYIYDKKRGFIKTDTKSKFSLDSSKFLSSDVPNGFNDVFSAVTTWADGVIFGWDWIDEKGSFFFAGFSFRICTSESS